MGKAATKAKNKYNSSAYDSLHPFVPKGRKAEIKAVADSVGESLNEFVVTAIDERIEKVSKIRKKAVDKIPQSD